MNVVIYTRANSEDDPKIEDMRFELEKFCDMLGTEVVEWYWDYTDDPTKQKGLADAIGAMYMSTEQAILTYDLNSFCADVNEALKLIAQIHEQGCFVYFIDPYAVQVELGLHERRN